MVYSICDHCHSTCKIVKFSKERDRFACLANNKLNNSQTEPTVTKEREQGKQGIMKKTPGKCMTRKSIVSCRSLCSSIRGRGWGPGGNSHPMPLAGADKDKKNGQHSLHTCSGPGAGAPNMLSSLKFPADLPRLRSPAALLRARQCRTLPCSPALSPMSGVFPW